jgi:hypothetical protein
LIGTSSPARFPRPEAVRKPADHAADCARSVQCCGQVSVRCHLLPAAAHLRALDEFAGNRLGFPDRQFKNFTTSFPLQDDDAITFTLVGKQANAIQHLLDLGRRNWLFSRLAKRKWSKAMRLGSCGPTRSIRRKLSSNGAGILPPVEIDDSAIYQQARGTIIRDLKPVSADSYQGTDLTVFAAHLFQKYTLVDWDYAQNPNSIVWVARSDGSLLGPYLPKRARGLGLAPSRHRWRGRERVRRARRR